MGHIFKLGTKYSEALSCKVRRVAEQIYGQLLEKGIEVLFDDATSARA